MAISGDESVPFVDCVSMSIAGVSGEPLDAKLRTSRLFVVAFGDCSSHVIAKDPSLAMARLGSD